MEIPSRILASTMKTSFCMWMATAWTTPWWIVAATSHPSGLCDLWRTVGTASDFVTDLNGNERVLNYRFQVKTGGSATSVYLQSQGAPPVGRAICTGLAFHQRRGHSGRYPFPLAVDKTYREAFYCDGLGGLCTGGNSSL